MLNDDLENELRCAFARTAASIAVPDEARSRLLQRDYRPRRVHRGLTAGIAAAAAAAAAMAVLLAVGAGSPGAAAGPVLRLASSYTFQMPATSRLTESLSPLCALPPLEEFLQGSPGAGIGRGRQPRYTAVIKAAASSSRRCISLQLQGAYTPTAARPGPEISLVLLRRRGQDPRQVRVGRYHGVIFTVGWAYFGARHRVEVPDPQLVVQLPVGHGRMRDLAVAAEGLSRAELIHVVARGLSAPAPRA